MIVLKGEEKVIGVLNKLHTEAISHLAKRLDEEIMGTHKTIVETQIGRIDLTAHNTKKDKKDGKGKD